MAYKNNPSLCTPEGVLPLPDDATDTSSTATEINYVSVMRSTTSSSNVYVTDSNPTVPPPLPHN